jgi:hypothetical protein
MRIFVLNVHALCGVEGEMILNEMDSLEQWFSTCGMRTPWGYAMRAQKSLDSNKVT